MRYPALDSLRGLAALIVVVHHYLVALPAFYPYPETAGGWVGILLYSPLHLLWAGSEAVSLFFVLSGFVLVLPRWQGLQFDMEQFIVRRLWRIWVPMMVAVSLAACSAALIGAKDVSGTSTWFNAIWKGASVDAYAQHVLMLGSMDLMNSTYIPVVWSLKWEMWVSLLLPLVLLLARQRPLIIVSLGTLSIGWYWTASPYSTDVFRGLLRYLPMFVLGAVLSHHRQALTVWVTRLNDAMCAALLLLALLIIPVQWYGYAPQPLLGRLALNDYAVLLGAALLIVLALGWKRWQLWLERPGLLWLGRVSFSLYLYHALVLAVVVRLGAGLLPLPVLILTAFALTLGVAHLGYEYVERRAIERGRATTRPFRRNQA